MSRDIRSRGRNGHVWEKKEQHNELLYFEERSRDLLARISLYKSPTITIDNILLKKIKGYFCGSVVAHGK